MSLVLPSTQRIHPAPLDSVHPSLAHVAARDEDDDDDDDEPLTVVGQATSRDSRAVRKRSSKACDNCRKAKCKCEKGGDNGACRNCTLLGQECTFLGPSRKRGPPKGYIDAIETRLHQLEALLGTIIASPDPRAQSLIADLISDPLARHIIARVDEGQFGSRGRDQDGVRDPKARTHINSARTAILNGGVGFDVPPREWQDELGARIISSQHQNSTAASQLRQLTRAPGSTPRRSPEHDAQRRRLSSTDSTPSNSFSHLPESDSDFEQDSVTDALGQLSLNEHDQLRYHGKASGLHILARAPAYRADRQRMDETGIWKFPSSRVWPPVAEERDTDDQPAYQDTRGGPKVFELLKNNEEIEQLVLTIMPTRQQQERLLKLYFAYVHPVLPIIHREAFWRDWEASAQPDVPASSRIPTLLLLAIYAVAARYDSPPARSSRRNTMWAAGDRYLEAAKVLLNRSYASSKASTCQALLLLSYREIGIGAMAQAWLYVGMSVRMAQDLGLHRAISKWQTAGSKTFSAAEKQTRRCIWYGCVVMDKYVSTYIGRPLAVFERDYDTHLPDSKDEEGEEEMDELWVDVVKEETGEVRGTYEPTLGKVLECFSAASKLSAILALIVEALYSIRPPNSGSRSQERVELEERLEKWMLALPSYLRYDVTRGVTEGTGKVPPPHILTLHMMYWCSVLLLHRPFIRFKTQPSGTRQTTPESTTSDNSSAASQRAITLCRSAANYITKIVCSYGEHFSLDRAPAFLSYYVFSASIMHVTLLMLNPEDPQAQMGLHQCMSALENLDTTWPSAGRAYELLHESKLNIEAQYYESLRVSPSRIKRKTSDDIDEIDEPAGGRAIPDGDIQNVPINVTMRTGGARLVPLSELGARPIVGLRETIQLARAREGISSNSHTPSLTPIDPHMKQLPHSVVSSPAPSLHMPNPQHLRHPQPTHNSNYGPLSSGTYQHPSSVEPMFHDSGFSRWENEAPSFAQPGNYYGGSSTWDGGHVQPQPPSSGLGWSTSATRLTADGGNGRGQSTGEYWQDYQSNAFGNDIGQSLYGMMPPVGHVSGSVGLQSMFPAGGSGVYGNNDEQGGIPSGYSVYSRLS